uniref:Uncharacterized protein n=1 Tax=Anguilla anguilla TaxID=7936 RepID=A0A0E9PE00_ANGAN
MGNMTTDPLLAGSSIFRQNRIIILGKRVEEHKNVESLFYGLCLCVTGLVPNISIIWGFNDMRFSSTNR